MIPRYLTISGFLSYQAPVKIDFSDIRVACITGQNGAGKSAMLDAMTWALFGEARKNDESVINEAVDPQVANVVFDFSYESALYRIDRTMKKGRPKTVEFFIWSETTSEWRSLTEKTVGKTDKKICDVLHTNFRTFENVSFFLQGKADKFTSQNATSRKEILSDILGLEVWENYRVAASEKRQNVKNEISILESEISEAEKEIEEEAARREALAKVEKDLTEVGKRRELAAAQWESARRDELLLQTLQKSVDDLRSRESGVFSQLESEKKALAERETELAEQQKKTANSAKIEQDFNELIETREKLTQLNQQAAQYHQLETAKMKTKAAIENEKTRLEEERKALQREADDIQKKKSTELFNNEEDTKYLLENFNDVDYLIKTSEPFDDFSVILLPENLVFQIQEYLLSSDEELYQLIQYYE